MPTGLETTEDTPCPDIAREPTTPHLLPGHVPRTPDAEARHLGPWGGAAGVLQPGQPMSAPVPQFPLLGTDCHSGKCSESSGNQSFMGTVSPCVTPYNLHHSGSHKPPGPGGREGPPASWCLGTEGPAVGLWGEWRGAAQGSRGTFCCTPLRAACSAHFSGPPSWAGGQIWLLCGSSDWKGGLETAPKALALGIGAHWTR